MQLLKVGKRITLASVLFYLLGTSTSALAFGDKAESKQPNILFLLVDDQRNDTLGCAGHPIVQTPVIDRLAADGVRFSNALSLAPGGGRDV